MSIFSFIEEKTYNNAYEGTKEEYFSKEGLLKEA